MSLNSPRANWSRSPRATCQECGLNWTIAFPFDRSGVAEINFVFSMDRHGHSATIVAETEAMEAGHGGAGSKWVRFANFAGRP